jgi:hypothetical protein
MKRLVLSILMGLVLMVSGTEAALAESVYPESEKGVSPTLFADGPGGNVTCEMVGNYNFASERFTDGEQWEGVWETITWGTSEDGKYVEWSGNHDGLAVIVKGGNNAYVYAYDGTYVSDSRLASPLNQGGNIPELSNLTFCANISLTVGKTADTSLTRTWDWTIDKTCDETSLTLLLGETTEVECDVEVNATGIDSDWAVNGVIKVTNPHPKLSAEITGIFDVINDDTVPIPVEVVCQAADESDVVFPYTLGAEESIDCTYDAVLPNADTRTNTATVTTGGAIGGGVATAEVVFDDEKTAINRLDEEVTIEDDKYDGDLGTVSALDDTLPKQIPYTQTVGPFVECGEDEFINTASVLNADDVVLDSDSWTIDIIVDCPAVLGCSLTQGYWRTHSEYGPAPYDETWAKLADGADTDFFESGQSYYLVLWTAPRGNAYYILAQQYIAATLNDLNGADTSAITHELERAKELFEKYKTPAEVASLKGKAGNAIRAEFIELAGVLDSYNNGLIGPGHCDDTAQGDVAAATVASSDSTAAQAPFPETAEPKPEQEPKLNVAQLLSQTKLKLSVPRH